MCGRLPEGLQSRDDEPPGNSSDIDQLHGREAGLRTHGEADPVTPSANATSIAERVGDNVRREIDAGTRRGWFIEHPDRLLELMTNFLD